MQKVASPRELQSELRTLLSYCQEARPSREKLAARLRTLADRVSGIHAPKDRLDARKIKEALAYVHYWEKEKGRAPSAKEAISAVGLSPLEVGVLLNSIHVKPTEVL